ncbi:leucine-rich repeat domain-containing protein [Ancylobacter lacus]|uniref:leucine-rich repeat domain-containing protein n=1 Tax=Ancylobacter lacus TaxID=2579970 RepID=UPI001BCEC403|nr:leucine-rich repeat domain-containing protein [Ancylobacter lacus]MBS7538771.1 hypothetical protein [Ancylobacter lacus]
MARNADLLPARAAFARLLDEYLRKGTRPGALQGQSRTNVEFADRIASSLQGSETGVVAATTVGYWRRGATLPKEIMPILDALFGDVAGQKADRDRLFTAYLAAAAEKAGTAPAEPETSLTTLAETAPDPAGAVWVAQGDRFVIDRSGRPSDIAAAQDPQLRQMQDVVRGFAEDLAIATARLHNAPSWSLLHRAARDLHALLDGDPGQMPGKLATAYGLLLRLGRCLETHKELAADPTQPDDPLPPAIHGPLRDVVRLAAPWLRGFPTVAGWDDAAGKALVRADLYEPARRFARIAHAEGAIGAADAAAIEALAAAAGPGFLGEKAGARAVASLTNLAVAGAGAVLGGGVSPLLAERARATLATAPAEVAALAESRPDDLKHALLFAVEEAARAGEIEAGAGSQEEERGAAAPESEPAPEVEAALPESIPEDVEAQARAMILEGYAPPVAWRPFIKGLNFQGTELESLEPLAGLDALSWLTLSQTAVTDLTPLAGLTAISLIDLPDTNVTDLSPLAGMTALSWLDLCRTKVTDLTPLAGMTALSHLDLLSTKVTDLAPLAGLTALSWLNLNGTKVTDITPLAGLTALDRLDLRNTSVTDLAPLAGLTALTWLFVSDWGVAHFAPLAGLPNLNALSTPNDP